jgi:hypothetical protein
MYTASSRHFVLAILALTVIALAATIPAQAGNTIPLLTGTFGGGGYTNMMSCFASAPSDPPPPIGPNNNYSPIVPATQSGGVPALADGSGMSFAFTGNYTSLNEFNQGWFDGQEQWCQSSYYGNMNGILTGEVDFISGGSITFTGGIWDGSSSGDSIMSNGCPSGCNILDFDSSMRLPFRGVWSNGWWSVGSFSAEEMTQGILLNGLSSVEMTTYTPEPTTLLLFGAGFLPIYGSLRRMLRRGE